MSKLLPLIVALWTLAISESRTQEVDIRLDTKFGGTCRDAEKSKSNKEDDWLCWAAAASNVLAWTGWGNTLPEADGALEDQILQYFCQHWTDDPAGSPREAFKWWFDGTLPSGSGAIVDVPVREKRRTGGFHPGSGFPDYKWESPKGALFRGVGKGHLRRNPLALRNLIDEGYGVALQVVRPLPNGERDSHMITLWGYRRDNYTPFKGIIITDSDDSKEAENASEAKNRLRYYTVQKKDDMWWFNYKEEDWMILAAYALKRSPQFQTSRSRNRY